jgi:hypothetical protein
MAWKACASSKGMPWTSDYKIFLGSRPSSREVNVLVPTVSGGRCDHGVGLNVLKITNPDISEVNLCCFGRGLIVDVASGVGHKD